ncbi:hypothetical protein K2173_012591 [Erythroxylum novogranatense]|uniref:Scarecrow-like protein 9 n=1 Tax=Erythroxylum novogranatense TaxID=1862640 RepID=A0AAV8T100_9ROSI|nr:hypothetical protein K2173_012591 [Erythroxylum novogranatense]
MVMDQSLRRLYGCVSKLKLHGETNANVLDQNLTNGFRLGEVFLDQSRTEIPPTPPDSTADNVVVSVSTSQAGELNDDFDVSDVVLKYISEMLLEGDMEEKTCMFQESSAALQAAEKTLYELIGQKYPPPSNCEPVSQFEQNHVSPEDNHDLCLSNDTSTSSSTTTSSSSVDPASSHDSADNRFSRHTSQSASKSSYGSVNSPGTVTDGFTDSAVSTLRISKIFTDSDSVMQFKKGFEEASKFIPRGGLLDMEKDELFHKDLKEEVKDVVVEEEYKGETWHSAEVLRGKKNPHPVDLNSEGGRSNKQSAIYTESPLSSEDFDRLVLGCKNEAALREALQSSKNRDIRQNGQAKGSNGGRPRGKKQGGKRNVVDLRTLLTLCAQAVAADDRRNANNLLKQIRQNSSSTGDGMQRLAHIFADGLEARLAGSGTQIYEALITQQSSAAVILKAYHLYLAACPFRKLSNFFSNKSIMNLAEKATSIHIVDFGIYYGFQWPCLIHRLSSRPGGPPKLRITGIDFPRPGFRPAERVEETGNRLANYAKTYNVPFEFNAIAQKWNTIQIEDLKIDRDEVLVVNSLYRLRNVLDETVVVESPRNVVLDLIRKMNPDVFILGVVNGAYSAPFFLTRFREALFHYSTLFDMLETNVPREISERMLIEREIFGREAMNVIACEGVERIERPETYKQWHARVLRAGFRQLPLNQEILKTAKEKVNAFYHGDFVIDEDSQWLLQGWKGRIVHALSTWQPDS